MKKISILLISLLFVIGLVACDEPEVEEKEVSSVESSDNTDKTDATESDNDAAEEAEKEENKAATYDEVLLDDDTVTVILKSIETERDDIFGDQHNIKMEIENKSDKTIEVQAHEVSIDGVMVDDLVVFSETVSAGKKANGNMSIMQLDEELPELNENIEFVLKIIDYETFMDISSTDVSVNVK